METKEILKWTAKIIACVALAFVINILSDEYGKGRVIITTLAIALLLYSIGKLLLKKK
jgi:hypothetical protein